MLKNFNSAKANIEIYIVKCMCYILLMIICNTIRKCMCKLKFVSANQMRSFVQLFVKMIVIADISRYY